MSFLDEVRAIKPNRARCGVALLLPTLPDDLRADVEAAIADASIYTTAIAAALAARGYEVPKAHTWQSHRRGKCSCG